MRKRHTSEEEQHLRVLIVDDNPSICKDFKYILGGTSGVNDSFDTLADDLFGDTPSTQTHEKSRTQYHVHSESTGRAALEHIVSELAENRPYAVVFIDVCLGPGWDGVKTAHHLWQADPELQIVFCTAHSNHNFETIACSLKNPDHMLVLKKPFETIEVRQLARALTQKWKLKQHNQQLTNAVSQTQKEAIDARRDTNTDRSEKNHSAEYLATTTATLRHEINTPLCYLMTNIEFVQTIVANSGLSQESKDEVAVALQDALAGVKRIANLVRKKTSQDISDKE